MDLTKYYPTSDFLLQDLTFTKHKYEDFEYDKYSDMILTETRTTDSSHHVIRSINMIPSCKDSFSIISITMSAQIFVTMDHGVLHRKGEPAYILKQGDAEMLAFIEHGYIKRLVTKNIDIELIINHIKENVKVSEFGYSLISDFTDTICNLSDDLMLVLE